jgi:hypothetical protein
MVVQRNNGTHTVGLLGLRLHGPEHPELYAAYLDLMGQEEDEDA